MILSCGLNDCGQLGKYSNSKIHGNSIRNQPLPLEADPFSVSSLSSYWKHTAMINNDGEAFGLGDNRKGQISGSLSKEILAQFTQIDLLDNDGQKYGVISAVCGNDYTLYLVLNLKGNFNQLLYASSKIKSDSPVILDTENIYPISLYGGASHAAAINSKGSVIFIPSTINVSIERYLDPSPLDCAEEIISVACCDGFIYVLSSSGKVYSSATQWS